MDAATRRPQATDPNERDTVIRTHEAGTLRASDAGQTVTLAGWVATRRDHGGVTFIDLRDASGTSQVVLRGAAEATASEHRSDEGARSGASAEPTIDGVHALRNEWVIAVTGEVRLRPEGNVNPAI